MAKKSIQGGERGRKVEIARLTELAKPAKPSKKPVDKQAKFNDWMTPERLLRPIHTLAGGQIGLDPATSPGNPAGARKFFTKNDDSLHQEWGGHGLVFLNPPYGKEIVDGVTKTEFSMWTGKVRRESDKGVEIVTLYSSARHETLAWQNSVFCPKLTAFCHVRGRVAFVLPPEQIEERRLAGKKRPEDGGNPDSNELYFYNLPYERVAALFIDVGLTVRVTEFMHYNGGEFQEQWL